MATTNRPQQGVYTVASRGVNTASSVTTRQPAATPCCCPVCTGLQCLDRTRFFSGQLLSDADLTNEQSYWLAKSRLHNRYLNGWGVVCGMQVTCGACAGWVVVQPGYAIDPCGNDIIVCDAQNFNVAQAIQQCCAPAAQATPNCSPLRYNPSPSCQDTTQEWCITIQYQEQPSRLVTPLSNSASPSSCSCGCSNGNGTSSSKSKKSSSNNLTTSGSCQTATAPTPSAVVPAGACEATRILEGFTLGVVPASEVEAELLAGNPNSLLSQLQLCILELASLLERAPDLTTVQNPYQSICNYLAQVTQALSGATNITLCAILSELGLLQTQLQAGNDQGSYVGILAAIKKLLTDAFRNCVCYALIPPCPPPACDNRIVLACFSIRNGEVINICHYPGRKQLITLQTLGYWLGPLGLDNLGLVLGELFELICCGTGQTTKSPVNSTRAYYNESVTTAGVTSGADFNRIAAHYIAQNVGANVLNAISPDMRAVDLRTLVNKPTETVKETLGQQGFKTVTTQAVDDDPAWTAGAVASSAQFAPAAVSAGQPLIVYTMGDQAVGFDVVDPTTAKLQDLQSQITALQSQLAQQPQVQQQTNTAGQAAAPATKKSK
jgi:hypothetical protein